MALKINKQMLIFFLVVLSVYLLDNTYLFIKGYRALSGSGHNTLIYTIIFSAFASTFIIGKILENSHSNIFTDILNLAGGFWMAFMLYGTLAWLAADILMLLQKPFRLITPESVAPFRFYLFAGIATGVTLLIIAGLITAVSPVRKHYDIPVDKKIDNETGTMRIVAVSDIHLGSIIRKRSMRHLSGMIADEKPDLVLFLGDVIDGSIGPVLRGDLLASLHLPEMEEGPFAITGNHEFIGGMSRAVPYIESRGIKVLLDETVILRNGVRITGRIDRSAGFRNEARRMPLDSLLADADPAHPLILLDHQPYELEKLAGTPVDLQLSGHTHNGQMWPLNIITRKLFELSYGHAVFGNAHVIVSSGFGLWGPRVRIGTRPEILVIDLKGKSE